MRKFFAVAVCIVVLGIQLVVLVAPSRMGEWYWPFVVYAMYATAKEPGETFRMHELHSIPCRADENSLQISADDVRLRMFVYVDLLANTADELRLQAPDSARVAQRRLSHLVATQLPSAPCAVELREQSMVTSREGASRRVENWQVIGRWEPEATP